MKKIIVMGHDGYAEGIRKNLEMIVGKTENMYFVDLTKQDDLASFENKVKNLLENFDDEVLFSCDVLGASPFRVAAMLCVSNPNKYCAVVGINQMAYLEISMGNDLSVYELANRAVETTKTSVTRFPN